MFRNKNYSKSHSTTVGYVREGDDAAAATAEASKAAELQKQIQAAVDAATAGLKNKNEELLGKMAKAADRVKQFEGLDPVALKTFKERMDTDEDAKLIAEGKKNELIDKYTVRMREQHNAELKAREDALNAEKARANSYRSRVLDDAIRSVVQGLHPGAVEDALLHARNIFSLDDKGNAVQLDSEGRPVLGKDGSTPFSPAEWIELQKNVKPHWFPNGNTGSGSSNAREANGVGKAIKRADFDRLPGLEQARIARSGVKITD